MGQVVTPFDPMEEPEVTVELGNNSEERDINRDARPEAEPAAGWNLEGGHDSEDDRDQDSDQSSIAEQYQELGGPVEPELEEDLVMPPPEAPRTAGSRSSRRQRVTNQLYSEKNYLLTARTKPGMPRN